MVIVLPIYNNTGKRDSWDYSLALRLTDRFHNELVNDLIPAVEGKYHTYAESTDPEGLAASRDYRGFGGFSMGAVNTWCTFRYCLDYFRYFMPMSGSYTADGEYMAELVHQSGYEWDDFFLFTASGTNDFAYSAFLFWNGRGIPTTPLPVTSTLTTNYSSSGAEREYEIGKSADYGGHFVLFVRQVRTGFRECRQGGDTGGKYDLYAREQNPDRQRRSSVRRRWAVAVSGQ